MTPEVPDPKHRAALVEALRKIDPSWSGKFPNLPKPLQIRTPDGRNPVDEVLARERDSRKSEITPERMGGGALRIFANIARELSWTFAEQVGILRISEAAYLPLQEVALAGKDVATQVARTAEVYTRAKRLVLDFGQAAAEKPVSMHLYYFTPGFRWVPTYRINGNLKNQASLALQGEIINDNEDLADAGVDLVVGVPNFRFKDVVSPLILERTLRNLPAASGDNNLNNMLQSQVAFNNSYRSTGGGEAPNPGLPAELAAGSGGEQDLFVYPLENFSLAREGRATAALWQNTVPVRNVYTYEIKARRNRLSGGQVLAEGNPSGNPNGPNRIVLNQIWHQLELTNTSQVPWTTGAAITMRDNLPLGQDLLTYTSVGGKTLLPLTIAVDLRGTSDEEEISRKPNAAHLDDYEYSLVQKKGTITITNSRKEPSEVCISVATGGKIEKASDGGKVKINDFRAEDWDEGSYMRVNNHSDVSWEFTLQSGETKTVEYTVSFYVR